MDVVADDLQRLTVEMLFSAYHSFAQFPFKQYKNVKTGGGVLKMNSLWKIDSQSYS